MLARFPEGFGQIKFLRDRLLGRQAPSSSTSDGDMRIAYLVNQYPKVSHSFIRREILALERQGFEVIRIALRGWAGELVDEEDRIERETYALRPS